ncbi:unnamed protein product [Mytilus edulis]|uniref:CARD domain-containing protein n=1 Tax=Mytilus edulis TaxID=6550 RepID=A0A8S3R7V8_MYTED|nr:unnamed protein product [Mytilus edulis]
MSLNEVLQKNYVNLIKMIDIVPLLDLLYEANCISHNECERLGKLSQTDRESANRGVLSIIFRKQSFDLDNFESLLFKSKQIRVLAVLFPDKYGSKKHVKKWFMDGLIDKETNMVKNSKMDNFKGLKNLLIRCNDYFVNCDVDRRLHTEIMSSGLRKSFSKHVQWVANGCLGGKSSLLTNLKVGNQVGTDEYKRGTLGGFVQVRGDKAFLTCLHVFLSADELASEDLSLDDEKTVLVKLYAMKSEYLNDSCVDYRPLCFSTPKPILHTFCVGAISGCQDSGASSASRTQVHENKDKNIDLESIEVTYSKAILDEIKTNVKVVIQSFQLNPFVVPPDDTAIKMKIEQNCDPNISAEIKSIVIDVIKNIYPTLQCAGGVDIDRFIHEVIFCNTQSRFAAITGDVHMQQTILRRTGQNMAIRRTSRRVYNQLYISNIPFKPGDSGTCIYVLSPVQGCIGMAIADHPQGGCIATPIKDILKHFKIRIK